MAEVARNHSLPSGYDEEFVNPVDEDFHCTICQLPSKEPIQTRCGHRFCGECIEEHFQRQERQGQYCTCPVDREILLRDKDIFTDKATERKILSLAIRCSSEGCEWTGELRAKESHLESCPFKVIPCAHENCQLMITRKDLEAHVTRECPWRNINCFYCQEPHAECQMEDHHKHCRRFAISCVCGAVVSREMVQDHTDNYCPKTVISCPYEKMGCKTKVLREKCELHLQSATGPHIKLVQEELTKTTRQLDGLEERLNNLQNRNKETYETQQEELNTVKRQLEKEVQVLKDELKKLHRAFEEKDRDTRKEHEEKICNLERHFEEKVEIIQKEDERRYETQQEELNTVKGQLEKEVQILKDELKNLHRAFEEKDHDTKKELEEKICNLERHFEEKVELTRKEDVQRCKTLQEEVDTVKGQLEKEVQILKDELENLHRALEEKDYDMRKQLEEKINCLKRHFEERVELTRKEDEQRCKTLQEELEKEVKEQLQNEHAVNEGKDNDLRKQLEEKINILENEVNAIRNELAAYEERFEDRVNRANWNTNVKIIGSVVASLISFAFLKWSKSRYFRYKT